MEKDDEARQKGDGIGNYLKMNRQLLVYSLHPKNRRLPMSLCILIVDDSSLIRQTVREALEEQPDWLVCGEAENGRQAIEKAQQLKPDLIILDLSMPIMNGLEAAQVLKKLMPAVPLVMFTSFKTNHLHQQALAAGVNTLIMKSDSESLVALVNSIRSLLVKQVA